MVLRRHVFADAGPLLAALLGLATVVVNFLLGVAIWKAFIAGLLVFVIWLGASAFWPKSSAASTQVPPGPKALTPRQREIVKLVAQGLTNDQIGRTLVPPIKEGSVEASLTAIYTKLNLVSKTALATWAVQHGLVDPPSTSNTTKRP